ncbi:MAG: hypothetical protein WCP17_03780 [bacterium]
MAIKPWAENIWFSPCYVISELARTVATRDKGKIKRAKEAWICAVAMICHSKLKPAEWWIQIPQNDPPDVLAMNFVPHEGGLGQSMSMLYVEVFEISEHDNESIEKSIERKLGTKDYSGMTLIAFVRRKEIFEHEKVATYIQQLKPKALCIFLIVSEENNTNFSLVQLFPECVKFKHDFGIFCKTTDQRDFIELTRSTKIKKEDNTTNDILTLIP